MNVNDIEINNILKTYKKITVYGLSKNPDKPSQYVPIYMRDHGYDIVGIYPSENQIAGFTIYPNLSVVPKQYLKFVNVFQRSEKIPELVQEIIKLGSVEVLWLQLGITNPEAEKLAEQAGIKVISNRCLKIEYAKIS